MQNNSDYFNKLVSCYLAVKILKKKLNYFLSIFMNRTKFAHPIRIFFVRKFQPNQFLMYIIPKQYKHPF